METTVILYQRLQIHVSAWNTIILLDFKRIWSCFRGIFSKTCRLDNVAIEKRQDKAFYFQHCTQCVQLYLPCETITKRCLCCYFFSLISSWLLSEEPLLAVLFFINSTTTAFSPFDVKYLFFLYPAWGNILYILYFQIINQSMVYLYRSANIKAGFIDQCDLKRGMLNCFVQERSNKCAHNSRQTHTLYAIWYCYSENIARKICQDSMHSNETVAISKNIQIIQWKQFLCCTC